MGQLYRLDRSQFVDIPTPYNSQATDTYAILEMDDTDYPLLESAATAIVKENTIASGNLHVINSSLGSIVVRLTLLADETVKVDSFCADFPSHTTSLDKISVVGSICEIYPKGFKSRRWILWEPSMGDHSLPALAKTALKATS